MTETVSVLASGPAFSLLLYETLKNEFGQEGFLVGSIVEKQTKTITDNDQRQTNITRIINVNGVIPCPYVSFFYNGIGKIDEEILESFLEDEKSSVIAWYRYKANSYFELSFREKVVHNQLSEFFGIPHDLFPLCLLTSDQSVNGSTHSSQQIFLRNRNNRYEPLPFHIMNLSDNKNVYKTGEQCLSPFQKILDDLKKTRSKESRGIEFITDLENNAQKHMESVIKELTEEEAKLVELEKEIKGLLKERNNEEIELTTDESLEGYNSAEESEAANIPLENNSFSIQETQQEIIVTENSDGDNLFAISESSNLKPEKNCQNVRSKKKKSVRRKV
ncbi:hypothetical protein WA026_005910 [Henosepilachna vigintioctopunctata]|uniref:Uncharacterized protein n=1 Tax=Henosepilachna vigintioctopunctata TaxID=420089 RepID=A0AAW1U4E0_9CUCU